MESDDGDDDGGTDDECVDDAEDDGVEGDDVDDDGGSDDEDDDVVNDDDDDDAEDDDKGDEDGADDDDVGNDAAGGGGGGGCVGLLLLRLLPSPVDSSVSPQMMNLDDSWLTKNTAFWNLCSKHLGTFSLGTNVGNKRECSTPNNNLAPWKPSGMKATRVLPSCKLVVCKKLSMGSFDLMMLCILSAPVLLAKSMSSSSKLWGWPLPVRVAIRKGGENLFSRLPLTQLACSSVQSNMLRELPESYVMRHSNLPIGPRTEQTSCNRLILGMILTFAPLRREGISGTLFDTVLKEGKERPCWSCFVVGCFGV